LVHLPLCHVFGRTSDYHTGALQQGGIMVFAEALKKYRKILQKSDQM